MSLAEVGAIVTSCILSRKGDTTIEDLEDDYFNQTGKEIPVETLGFNCLMNLLVALPDIVVITNSNGQITVKTFSNKAAHISKLVSMQRTVPKKKKNKKKKKKQNVLLVQDTGINDLVPETCPQLSLLAALQPASSESITSAHQKKDKESRPSKGKYFPKPKPIASKKSNSAPQDKESSPSKGKYFPKPKHIASKKSSPVHQIQSPRLSAEAQQAFHVLLDVAIEYHDASAEDLLLNTLLRIRKTAHQGASSAAR